MPSFKDHLSKQILYHGSTTPNIKIFKPNKRSCPNKNVKPAVYATDIPALAVGFSFLWDSSEGFDIRYSGGKTTLFVPEKFASKLNVKIYIYEFSASDFKLSDYAPVGHNFMSFNQVKPLKVQSFNSVYDGMSHFNGKIVET